MSKGKGKSVWDKIIPYSVGVLGIGFALVTLSFDTFKFASVEIATPKADQRYMQIKKHETLTATAKAEHVLTHSSIERTQEKLDTKLDQHAERIRAVETHIPLINKNLDSIKLAIERLANNQ